MSNSWFKMLVFEMSCNDDEFKNIECCTLNSKELDVEFNDSERSINGKPFTCWTMDRVYFSSTYDGCESVESIPRNPSPEEPRHIGE